MDPCKHDLNLGDALSVLLPQNYVPALLDHYNQYIAWITPIIHPPTFERQVENVYASLEKGEQPDPGQLAIVATVCGLSFHYFSPSTILPVDGHKVKTSASRCLTLARSALWASDAFVKPRIETIQSIILISYHLSPRMGALQVVKILSSVTLNLCRMLNIHLVDSPRNKEKRKNENERIDSIDLEIKRRIWWHLASTDCELNDYLVFLQFAPSLEHIANVSGLLSFMGGHQSGSYSIHPQQMHVDKPSNVDNSDIGPHPAYARPMNVPTDMSYVHCWYSIAELSRRITDSMSNAGCEADDMPYDMLLELDSKFTESLGSMPTFFRLDPKSREETKHLDEQRPMLAYHRNMVHILFHTRLYRLHRPYLVAGSRNPRYSYSRMVCLRSARVILELGKKSIVVWGPAHTKLWTFIHHYLVATLVLVIDYSLNREDPRATERKEEIFDCFRTLEGCLDHSAVAKCGLQQLRNLLVNGVSHNIHPGPGNMEATGSRCDSSPTHDSKPQDMPTDPAPNFDPFLPVNPVQASTSMAASKSAMQIDPWPSANLSFEGINYANLNFDFGMGMEDQEFANLFATFENSDALY